MRNNPEKVFLPGDIVTHPHYDGEFRIVSFDFIPARGESAVVLEDCWDSGCPGSIKNGGFGCGPWYADSFQFVRRD